MERLRIELPIIVEGKYDKIKIKSVADACVIQTDGFGVFKNSERLSLIRQLAKKSKIIVLTDSDGAGKVIRSHITSAIPKDRLIQLYTPQVKGKERRKDAPSAEGFLGVEGTEADTLRRLLEPFATGVSLGETEREDISKADLYELGLTGGQDSVAMRDRVAVSLGLPREMSPNAFLAALNVIVTKDELADAVSALASDEK